MSETKTEKFILKKGGDLIRVKGIWNDDTEEWSYVEEIVEYPPNAYGIHDITFELEEGIHFRDVILYINKNLEYWNLILGNWCEEIVTSALNTPKSKKHGSDDDFEIEFLEIYNTVEVCKMDNKYSLEDYKCLQFHGNGVYIKDGDGYTKGDRLTIAIDFTPAQVLLDYPLIIKKDYQMLFTDYDRDYKKYPPKAYDNVLYSLTDLNVSIFQVFYAIFWELSFYGNPESTQDKFDELKKTVDDIKSEVKKRQE